MKLSGLLILALIIGLVGGYVAEPTLGSHIFGEAKSAPVAKKKVKSTTEEAVVVQKEETPDTLFEDTESDAAPEEESNDVSEDDAEDLFDAAVAESDSAAEAAEDDEYSKPRPRRKPLKKAAYEGEEYDSDFDDGVDLDPDFM